jgi:tetratricopeptide (TPR) repeat protein
VNARYYYYLYFFFFVVIVLLSTLPSTALAQGSGHTATPMPPSTITRPDSIQDTGVYNYWTYMTAQERAGGALLGKVKIEGEPLLWEPILITVNCNGTPVQTAQTDPKGSFAIVPTKISGALSLQGDAKRQMETHYEGCTVQSAFPGFHSSVVTVTQRNLRDDPDLGTIQLSREGGRAAGAAVSATSESAPANAVKSFEKARTEMLEQKPERAERDLKKAVEVYPNFAEAWYQLGRLQLASDSKEARSSFAHAVAADAKFILPYEQLSGLSAQSGDWRSVVDTTDHALQLEPLGTPRTWYLNALANFQLGKTDVAAASAAKSLTMDPSHTVPNTEQLLAVILARKADYAGALAHLRNCLTYTASGPNTDLLKQQIAELEQRVGGAK